MLPIVIPALVLMAVFFLCYQRLKYEPGCPGYKQIAVKCAATSMAVLVALLGCLRHPDTAHWIILAGLAVCTLADGVLCVRFIPGGVLFGIGHILYMIAFCRMNPPRVLSALVFLVLMGIVAFMLYRFRQSVGKQLPLFAAYATALCLMTALSAAQRPLFFAGALLFAISDLTLGYLLTGKGSRKLDNFSLACYYLGQFLLALGIWM